MFKGLHEKYNISWIAALNILGGAHKKIVFNLENKKILFAASSASKIYCLSNPCTFATSTA